ncbi:MAG: CPBP family intramembrane metalloprotease [Ruminococcaceae bacterium]|nr:CPBP family intramembrane metalloprotease [Oscillospiraceae bacterium]
MKSKIGKFIFATGGYVLYLLSGVLAALFLYLFQLVEKLFEKGSVGSFAESFGEISEKDSSLVLVISYALVLIVSFLLLKFQRKDVRSYTGILSVYPLGIFGAVVFGAILNFITFSIVAPIHTDETEITFLLLVCLFLGPFVEEFVFRGILFRMYGKVLGVAGAILMTSLLFAISHTGIAQMIYAFVLGIVLCMVRIRSKSLWNAVALHMSFNLSGTVLATSELELPDIAFAVLPVLIVLSFILACSGGRKALVRRK